MDDGKFLKGQISNPTPATINLNMTDKVDVHYRAKTDTQIDSITLKTNMAGGYIDADLQNIAPDVKVCFSSANKACQPGFVPNPTLTTGGGSTFNMPPALFDFSLIPTNLAGGSLGQSIRGGRHLLLQRDGRGNLSRRVEQEAADHHLGPQVRQGGGRCWLQVIRLHRMHRRTGLRLLRHRRHPDQRGRQVLR